MSDTVMRWMTAPGRAVRRSPRILLAGPAFALLRFDLAPNETESTFHEQFLPVQDEAISEHRVRREYTQNTNYLLSEIISLILRLSSRRCDVDRRHFFASFFPVYLCLLSMCLGLITRGLGCRLKPMAHLLVVVLHEAITLIAVESHFRGEGGAKVV